MCKGGGGSTTATSTQSPPPAVTAAYKTISQDAENAANQPLQQYNGPLLAGFSDLQNQGFSGIQGANSTLQPYLNSASGLVGQATQNIYSQLPQFNAQNIQQYENPYNNDVINATLGEINNQNSQQQSALQGNAVASGAWGGDRAGVAQAALAGQQDLAKNQTIAGLNSQNYQQAEQEFNNQQQTQLGALTNQAGLALQGAGLQGYLGNSALQGQLGVANSELTAGQQQQNQAQNALNIPYQQFLQQQAYPFQTTQFLANTLLGTAGTQGGTSTTSQPTQDNTASQILGLGLGVAGLFSDKRVKDNIKRVGKTDDGLPIYTFKYKGDDTTHMGLMAQDVEKKKPNAVGEIGGIKTVNYDKATKKQYASGGGVPNVDVNFIPLDATGGMNGMGIPAPPKLQQQSDQSASDILGPLQMEKSLGGLGGQGGLGNAIGSVGLNGSNPFVSSGTAFMGGLQGMYGPGFDSGGAVVNIPNITAPTNAATPYKSFIDLGGITGQVPVYSFTPPGSTPNNNNFSSTVYDVNHLDPSKQPAAPSAPAASAATSDQLSALKDYNLQNSGYQNQTSENRASGDLNFLVNSVVNPTGKKDFDPVGKTFVDYNGDPISKARGGGIKGYAAGSDVDDDSSEGSTGGINSGGFDPYDLKSLMGDSSSIFMNQNTNPQVTELPDFSASPLSSVLKAQSAGLKAAPTIGPSGGGLSPAPAASSTPAINPNAALNLAKLDPDLALSEAGFAMAANPSRNFLQNVASGAQAGLQNWEKQKSGQLSAQQEAEKLALEADKASQGKWIPVYAKDADGNITEKLFDSKNNKWADTPSGVSSISIPGASGSKTPTVKQFPDGTMRQWDGASWTTAPTGATATPQNKNSSDFGWADVEAKNATNLSPKQLLQAQKTNDKVQEAYDKNSMIVDNQMRMLDNLESLAKTTPGGGVAPYEVGAMNYIAPNSQTATQGANFNQIANSLVLGDAGFNYVPGMRGSDLITKLRMAAKPNLSMPMDSKISAINELRGKYMDAQLSSDIDTQYRNANNVTHLSSPVVDQIDRTLKTKYPITSQDENKNTIYNADNVAKIQALTPLAIQNGSDVLKNPDKYLAQMGGAATPTTQSTSSAPTDIKNQSISTVSQPFVNVPTIANPADAKKLPSGTQFMTPDGRLKVVP